MDEVNDDFKNNAVDELKKKYININNKNGPTEDNIKLLFDDRVENTKLQSMKRIENIIGMNRFEIDTINKTADEIKEIQLKLIDSINDIINLSNYVQSKKKHEIAIKKKINKIKKNDLLQKFVADCYNTFGDIIKYKITNQYIRVGKNKKTLTSYTKFSR